MRRGRTTWVKNRFYDISIQRTCAFDARVPKTAVRDDRRFRSAGCNWGFPKAAGGWGTDGRCGKKKKKRGGTVPLVASGAFPKAAGGTVPLVASGAFPKAAGGKQHTFFRTRSYLVFFFHTRS